MQLPLRSTQLPSLQMLNGLWFVALFAMSATLISQHALVLTLGLSPLIIGILLGTAYGNTLRAHMPTAWLPGITFSTRPLLRFAIVLYGFRLTFQDILAVGLPGIGLSLSIIVSTLLLGYFTGTRLLKMDRDTAFLTAIGSSICGAAAILAAEPVLQSKSHKSGIAVATVVVFGTMAMFLMPFLYKSGLLGMDEKTYGMFVGGTIHEVAHTVAAGSDISTTAGSNAIITKMIRVLLLAPVLIIAGLIFTRRSGGNKAGSKAFTMPWFAVMFLAVVAFNSLDLLPAPIVGFINDLDIFLLTMTMCALGMETSFAKLRQVGPAPIYLAAMLFAWLLGFGYLATLLFTSYL